MKKLLTLIVYISMMFSAYSGTGVGSPLIQQLPAFDYQMAFPSTWKVSNRDIIGNEGLFKEWKASNSPEVGESKKSEISIEFLSNFPAKNLSDLYREIQKRHPTFTFLNSSSKQISGWTSKLINTGGNFENWEYYFIAPKKIVRIHSLRKKDGYGVSHIEIILRSIRKISKGIEISNVAFKNITGSDNSISVGDKVCYEFSFDYPKELQSQEMISSFKVRYEKESIAMPIEKKILKERNFNINTGLHSICFNILTGMNKKEHFIESMEYEINGSSSSSSCSFGNGKLSCGLYSINLNVTQLQINSLDKKGPILLDLKFDVSSNTINMKLNDSSEINLIQIFAISQDDSEQKKIGVIFPDQIINGSVSYKFKRPFSPGTYINSVYLTDSSGNTSVLIKDDSTELFYFFKQIGESIKKTSFPIVGW